MMIPPPTLHPTIPLSEEPVKKKAAKKDKKKKIKGKRDLLEFYDLTKTKVTLEFSLEHNDRRARGQIVSLLSRKPFEEVKESLEAMREADTFKKVLLNIKY